MKTKNIVIIAFVVVAMIQLVVPAKMIFNYENILSKGKPYKFQIAPIDPSDPFRGKYIIIRIKENRFKVNRKDTLKYNEDIYVLTSTDSANGFVKIKDIVKEKPQANVDFIKAKAGYFNDSTLLIDYPFERYYLEESTAPKIERLYHDALWSSTKVSFVIVKVIDGNAVISDLVISGKSIK
ncbi:MAG TPA: GDYXXLXY domain-containing protein [Bacteroidales bacterium]